MLRINEIQILLILFWVQLCQHRFVRWHLQPSPHPPTAALKGHCSTGTPAPLYLSTATSAGPQYLSPLDQLLQCVWISVPLRQPLGLLGGCRWSSGAENHCLQPCLGGCWGAPPHHWALCSVLSVSSKCPCSGSVSDRSSSEDPSEKPSLTSLLSSDHPCSTGIVPCSCQWSGQWWHGARRRRLWKWSCVMTYRSSRLQGMGGQWAPAWRDTFKRGQPLS